MSQQNDRGAVMRIHILGICGTFMASIAVIAKELGYEVSGSDEAIFPPMSTMLAEHGIKIYPTEECALQHLTLDCVIVGNAKGRGDKNVEYLLNSNLPYYSGPEWLAKAVLRERSVITVSGTHGKTTTTSMIAWILDFAGLEPGFLVGGVPRNFGLSGRIGKKPYFVIEGDEYDTAFFDKRSKFIHYYTKVGVINNIEFDHADIFDNIAAIQKTFQHFIRTIPSGGLIIAKGHERTIKETLAMGCWTPVQEFGADDSRWQALLLKEDGSEFSVYDNRQKVAEIAWELVGLHNVNNALAAIAAANYAGVAPAVSAQALSAFHSVKRRLEIKGTINGVTVYDDFAHHPTEIKTTINGLRRKVGKARIITIIEFVSNSMKKGCHNDTLVEAFDEADLIFCRQPEWDVLSLFQSKQRDIVVAPNVDGLLASIANTLKPTDHVLVMSNKGFEGIYDKLLKLASEV